MAIPRSDQVDLSLTTYYHCITRCVRGAYLCGVDSDTGIDHSHRRTWILNLMKELAEGFAIQICAYAIMSNHYHIVLHVDVDAARTWSDEQVKKQWSKILPKSVKRFEDNIANGLAKSIADKIIQEWRERLTDISWFMRCLNEKIARWANQEDEKTGRFWEARFKSQALLDEGAILSAMAYVDLNPVRANIAQTPEGSDFTSIQERIRNLGSKNDRLMSFDEGDSHEQSVIDYKLSDYIELVDYAGRVVRADKRGSIADDAPPIFDRIGIEPSEWREMFLNIECNYNYGVGSDDMLKFCGFRKKYKFKKHPLRVKVPQKHKVNG